MPVDSNADGGVQSTPLAGCERRKPAPDRRGTLPSLRQLTDHDLLLLMELSADYLNADEQEMSSRADFWADVLLLLENERRRRRREILDLERLYFQS